MHYFLRKAEQPVCPISVTSNSKANENVYFRLDAEKSLVENLKGFKVLEFPTIYVLDEIPENWTIEAEERPTD